MCYKVFYPPLFNLKSIACILIPLTGGPLGLCEVGHALPFAGVLKGNMALSSDAHPYSEALF